MSDERERHELEGRIRELEATVETLTSELVDTTERVRELEAAMDAETAEEQSVEEGASGWVPASEEVEGNGSASSSDEDGSSRDSDEIIVA
ncbi:bZIP transcription factor [Halanaeroarchaeum sp. HSR-CO]|uniref:DUF7518 family protein n=1 Tax=Halanaeroarchaeum sp. HSR-CO TaxID=2866382 RepID=UPI00217E8982|nr:bZIP transcription factor [Halanaeroarchaeum sp. HSR-CO]